MPQSKPSTTNRARQLDALRLEKRGNSSGLRMLTPSERQSLLQKQREINEAADKAFPKIP